MDLGKYKRHCFDIDINIQDKEYRASKVNKEVKQVRNWINKKLFIGLIVSLAVFLVSDVIFFYYIVSKERDTYYANATYTGDVVHLPDYFIKLVKPKEAYKYALEEMRPIQNPDSNERPILIFGCSYAYGHVFDNTETISYVMSKYSNRPIINRAQSGWGIQHMLYQLKEDKDFVSSIKSPPRYIFYVLMDHGGHFHRLYHTSYPNITDRRYYFTYKYKNGKYIENKPLFNLYYGFALTRHIYNKLILLKSESDSRTGNKKHFDFVIRMFSAINDLITEYWGTVPPPLSL